MSTNVEITPVVEAAPKAGATACAWCGRSPSLGGNARVWCTTVCRRRFDHLDRQLRLRETAIAMWHAERGGGRFSRAEIRTNIATLRAEIRALLTAPRGFAEARPVPSAALTLAQQIHTAEARVRALHQQAADNLVTTIGEAVAGHAFNAAEVIEHVPRVGVDLRDALAAVRIDNAQRLGKLLRRLAGRTVRGLCIERVGADNGGAIWIVRVIADSHQAHCVDGDPSAQW